VKKHKFTLVLFIVVVILLYVAYYNFSNNEKITVNIKGHLFKTEIADNLKEQERGLSGRETMTDDQAMLFIFPNKTKRVFWMKDMNFNIDLLWIEDDQIVAYEKNMLAPEKDTPPSELLRYASPPAVNKVLEIKAGLIDRLGIKVGDIIISS